MLVIVDQYISFLGYCCKGVNYHVENCAHFVMLMPFILGSA